jgi:hypothetical protein
MPHRRATSAIPFPLGILAQAQHFPNELFQFVIIAGKTGLDQPSLAGTLSLFQAAIPRPAIKAVRFHHFSQSNGCVVSIRCRKNNFEKFSAMLAGAQNFRSDAGNLVFS